MKLAIDDSPQPGMPPASDRRRPAWLTRTLREIGPRWARGHAPLHVTMADHNHVSIMAHFNTPEQLLGEMVLDFFEHACS